MKIEAPRERSSTGILPPRDKTLARRSICNCGKDGGGGNVRENESVTVDPLGVLGVELHEFVEQDVGDGSHAHGRTRVTRVGLGGGIDLW